MRSLAKRIHDAIEEIYPGSITSVSIGVADDRDSWRVTFQDMAPDDVRRGVAGLVMAFDPTEPPPEPPPALPADMTQQLAKAILAQGDEIIKLKAALGALAREAGGA